MDKNTRTQLDALAFSTADLVGPVRMVSMAACHAYSQIDQDTDPDASASVAAAVALIATATAQLESAAERLLSWIALDVVEP